MIQNILDESDSRKVRITHIAEYGTGSALLRRNSHSCWHPKAKALSHEHDRLDKIQLRRNGLGRGVNLPCASHTFWYLPPDNAATCLVERAIPYTGFLPRHLCRSFVPFSIGNAEEVLDFHHHDQSVGHFGQPITRSDPLPLIKQTLS